MLNNGMMAAGVAVIFACMTPTQKDANFPAPTVPHNVPVRVLEPHRDTKPIPQPRAEPSAKTRKVELPDDPDWPTPKEIEECILYGEMLLGAIPTTHQPMQT